MPWSGPAVVQYARIHDFVSPVFFPVQGKREEKLLCVCVCVFFLLLSPSYALIVVRSMQIPSVALCICRVMQLFSFIGLLLFGVRGWGWGEGLGFNPESVLNWRSGCVVAACLSDQQ